jgi:hypothetical protein
MVAALTTVLLDLVDAKELAPEPTPLRDPPRARMVVPHWIPLLPGTAFWALALYLPLSLPLGRLEAALAEGTLPEGLQQVVLVAGSLLLALAVGGLTNLAIGWALGPGWAGSLGLIAAGWGGFTALASRARDNGE